MGQGTAQSVTDSSHCSNTHENFSHSNLSQKSIQKLYTRRNKWQPWILGPRVSSVADSLIAFIENIRYYGLQANDYHIAEIHQLKNRLDYPESKYQLEKLLTDAYITISRHIRFGKAFAGSDEMDSLSLSSLEKIAQHGGLIKNITAGESSLTGYRALKRGLKQFLDSLSDDQRNLVLSNSALIPDSINHKLQAVEINIERWRAERKSFGSRYIFINIPAFMLYVMENDSVILESKVIVGTPEKQTPELSSVIECFITYPYWNVPRKIAIEEYLPILKQDTAFLSRNNFDVLDRRGKLLDSDSVPWKNFTENYFPVMLRQREGPENSLGVIKFVFDNPYAVFLHDTNAKRLFRSKERAYSHGCIRMEKAVELAHYLKTGKLESESRLLSKYLGEKQRYLIDVKNPIPIYTRYFTCEFTNGKLFLYKDIYSKDKELFNVLYNNFNKTDL